jgi:hypothetical protein|nr:MAG TPA: DNA-directed RNA polymerase [Caudoviricetes sp.]
MTREEAIECLKTIQRWTPDWDDREDGLSYWDAIDMALSALRPVSREQVERLWPGCEACKDAGLAIGEVQFYGPFEGPIDVSGNMHYCPNCGRPITPVAKDRQGKRLEALNNDKK